MKKSILFSGLVAGIMVLSMPQSAITGSVLPADGAESIMAFSAGDSARGVILNTGSFSLSVKPGIYKILVESKAPYKDVLLENLEVKDGRPLDIGQIVLQK